MMNLKIANHEETMEIYEQQRRDAKATMIEFLNDVVPNAPRDVNAMDYLNESGHLVDLVNSVLIMKDELLEMCSK